MNWRRAVARWRGPVARSMGRGPQLGHFAWCSLLNHRHVNCRHRIGAAAFTVPRRQFTCVVLQSPRAWKQNPKKTPPPPLSCNGFGGDLKQISEGPKRYMPSPVPILTSAVPDPGSLPQPRGRGQHRAPRLWGFSCRPGRQVQVRAHGSPKSLRAQTARATSNMQSSSAASPNFSDDWFRTRVEVRRDVIGHNGPRRRLPRRMRSWTVTERVTVSAGPRVTMESRQATAQDFRHHTVHAWPRGMAGISMPRGRKRSRRQRNCATDHSRMGAPLTTSVRPAPGRRRPRAAVQLRGSPNSSRSERGVLLLRVRVP